MTEYVSFFWRIGIKDFSPSHLSAFGAEPSQKSVSNHGWRSESGINHVRRRTLHQFKVSLGTRSLQCGSKDKKPPHLWQMHYIINDRITCLSTGLQQRIETNKHLSCRKLHTAEETCLVSTDTSFFLDLIPKNFIFWTVICITHATPQVDQTEARSAHVPLVTVNPFYVRIAQMIHTDLHACTPLVQQRSIFFNKSMN